MATTDAGAPRIGLLGMYASANLGDTCIQAEVLRNLRARLPNARFVAISNDPADAVATFGLDAARIDGYLPALRADGSSWRELEAPWPAPLRAGQGTRRILAILRSLDLLIVSGGGQLEDFFGGAGAQPRYLLTWASLARLAGVPVVFFSVGVDQLRAPSSRRRIGWALSLARARSFRDAGSLALARQCGMRGPAEVCPDPALGVPYAHGTRGDGRGMIIAVSPVSHRTFQVSADADYDAYVAALIDACRAWRTAGHALRFVCSETEMDPVAAARIVAALGPVPAGAVTVIDARTPDAFCAAVEPADVLVTSRLHGAILGAVAGTPVLALSPARKLTQFMQDGGLVAHCLALRTARTADMLAAAQTLLRDGDGVRATLRTLVQRSREELDRAYDRLAAAVGAGPAR